LLVSALEPHLGTLQNLNFSENKIGIEGAEVLSESLSKMKSLEVLNIGSNSLGDEAVNGILKGLTGLLNLK
jgi:Ran GTPase-activating protein (RanGAP) involved in mRNA processing and transport